jgi:hypothetical protein
MSIPRAPLYEREVIVLHGDSDGCNDCCAMAVDRLRQGEFSGGVLRIPCLSG